MVKKMNRRQMNAIKWQMQPGRWNWRWTSRYRSLKGEGDVLGSNAGKTVPRSSDPEPEAR